MQGQILSVTSEAALNVHNYSEKSKVVLEKSIGSYVPDARLSEINSNTSLQVLKGFNFEQYYPDSWMPNQQNM